MNQALIELIDAYGAARASSNTKLITMSAFALQEFLQRVEIVAKEADSTSPEVVADAKAQASVELALASEAAGMVEAPGAEEPA